MKMFRRWILLQLRYYCRLRVSTLAPSNFPLHVWANLIDTFDPVQNHSQFGNQPNPTPHMIYTLNTPDTDLKFKSNTFATVSMFSKMIRSKLFYKENTEFIPISLRSIFCVLPKVSFSSRSKVNGLDTNPSWHWLLNLHCYFSIKTYRCCL